MLSCRRFEVRDAAGQLWTLKFGSEVRGNTFVPRLLNSLGYAGEPAFSVRSRNLEAGLTASGASGPVAREFTRLIRERILQLQGIAEASKVQQVAK